MWQLFPSRESQERELEATDLPLFETDPAHPEVSKAVSARPADTSLDPSESAVGSVGTNASEAASGPPCELSGCFRHSGWEKRREKTARAIWAAGGSVSRVMQFCSCGSSAWVLQSTENAQKFKIVRDFCHDRFCIPCAKERGRVIEANVCKVIENKQIRFLTLTLRADGQPLRERVSRLIASFRKLRARKWWGAAVYGGVAILEVKYNGVSRNWNAHFHILYEGRFVPQSLIADSWLAITGDSYVIDIRLVRTAAAAARYVSKYVGKPLGIDDESGPGGLVEAVRSLRGRKLLYTFGNWRKYRLLERPTDDAWKVFCHLNELAAAARLGDSRAELIFRSLALLDDDCFFEEFFIPEALPPPGTGFDDCDEPEE